MADVSCLDQPSTSNSSKESSLVLTAGSDCKVQVWRWDVSKDSEGSSRLVFLSSLLCILKRSTSRFHRPLDKPVLLQTISTNNKIPLASAISFFPGTNGMCCLCVAFCRVRLYLFLFHIQSLSWRFPLPTEKSRSSLSNQIPMRCVFPPLIKSLIILTHSADLCFVYSSSRTLFRSKVISTGSDASRSPPPPPTALIFSWHPARKTPTSDYGRFRRLASPSSHRRRHR